MEKLFNVAGPCFPAKHYMLPARDYKAQIRPDGQSLGQISPFNIISEDLMLRNFTEEKVAALYAQHTEAP